MAYTGILLRGANFNTIYNDAPISREIVMAGEHLGFNTFGGVNYWLNIAALSFISSITDNQGNYSPGFKTSDLPITYDGVGYIKEESTHMLINSAYKFNYINLDFMSSAVPIMSTLTVNDVVVTFTQGVKAVVFNETTRTELGIVDTSGTTLTFGAAQTIGDIITAKCLDADYNHSTKHKLVIS